MESFKRERDR